MATHYNRKEYTLHEGIACGINGKLPALRLPFLLFLIVIFSLAPPIVFNLNWVNKTGRFN